MNGTHEKSQEHEILKVSENSSDEADTLSPDVVFHVGSFGKSLRAVRAQMGVFFIKKKQKIGGVRRKGWNWR